MLCPNCGNTPRTELQTFLSTGTPSFRCRECGKRIHGTFLVVALDLFSYVGGLSGVVGTFALSLGATPLLSVEEAAVFSVVGLLVFRSTIVWLQRRYGSFRRCRRRA